MRGRQYQRSTQGEITTGTILVTLGKNDGICDNGGLAISNVLHAGLVL